MVTTVCGYSPRSTSLRIVILSSQDPRLAKTESTPAGFELQGDGVAIDKTGIDINLTIDTENHTIPEIGKCIRSVSKNSIDADVIYRIYKRGTIEEELKL